MALSAAGLQSAIETELDNSIGAAEDTDAREAFAEAIAKAVIDYLKANAVPTGQTVTTAASGTWPLTTGALT